MPEPDSASTFSGNVDNRTSLELSPTPLSTSTDPSSGPLSGVYVYVSMFLSLLALLLLLLLAGLQRLRNVVSAGRSCPEHPGDAGSPCAHLEVCSVSSQRSALSDLSP